MNYVSWPIILLIIKYGDNVNASFLNNILFLWGTYRRVSFFVHVAYTSALKLSFYILRCLLVFFIPNTFFLCPVQILLDVRLDQPQQRIVPAESHGDWCELPTCPWPTDAAQSLCHEFHGELKAQCEQWVCAHEWGKGWHVRPPPTQRSLWTCERWSEKSQAGLWQQPSFWKSVALSTQTLIYEYFLT